MSHLKACTAVDATPGSLQRQAWQSIAPHLAVHDAVVDCRTQAQWPRLPPPTRRSSCHKAGLVLDLLVSPPSQQEQPRTRPGTFFSYPAGRFLHIPGQQLLLQPLQKRYPQTQRKPPTRIDL